MREIMLVLTEKCNLACRYCYENQEMYSLDFDMAKEILDKELMTVSDSNIQVSFFGGEPLLKFPLICQVYEYMEQEYGQYDTIYNITTNGTLIHGEIQSWLEERKDRFHITLSLDGTPDMHNRNRVDSSGKGTFDQIDLTFFLRTWPRCVAKMTISQDTCSDFADGIIYLDKMGFRCKANFASGIDFDLKNQKEVIIKNMMQLIDYYSANDSQLCFMLDLNLKQILIPPDENFRYCEAGTVRHCYDAEGDGWYPCQGLTRMAIAGRSTEFRECSFMEPFPYIMHNNMSGEIKEELNCKACSFIRICRTCYAMNYSATGNVWQPDNQICYLNRLCMLASARIQYNRIKRKKIIDPTLTKAIFMIASELNELGNVGT